MTRITWDNVLLVSLNTRLILGLATAGELLDFNKLDPKSMGLPGRFGFTGVGPFSPEEYS